MLKVGDRVFYWYQMNRLGTIVDFIKDSKSSVWLEGSTPSIPTKAVVQFDNGETLSYSLSELRLVD